QTPLTQLTIGRPVRLIERSARGVDGAMHIGLRRIGDLAQNLLVGRIDIGKRAYLPIDELSVDQHSRLERCLRPVSHDHRLLAGPLVAQTKIASQSTPRAAAPAPEECVLPT